ncbi:Chitinase domain-containing protein 1 [Hordeum vulgare]|nr:Chitinase domain-containing protein 1 [Hordeum vulgare]
MRWRAVFLGCSLADGAEFEDTMKVCSNLSSMEEVHKKAVVVVKKAMAKELKTLILGPSKGAMSVNILRWAMNHADSEYQTIRTVVDPTEDDEEVQMVARAPMTGDRAKPIVLDGYDEEEDNEEEKKMPKPHRHST